MTTRTVRVVDDEDEELPGDYENVRPEPELDDSDPDWLVEPVVLDATDMPWDYTVGGKSKVVKPQKGRWLKVLPLATDDVSLILQELRIHVAVAEDETQSEARRLSAAEKASDLGRAAQEWMGGLVVDWNLVGWDRLPLPRPRKGATHADRTEFFAEMIRRKLPAQAVQWLGSEIGRLVNGGDDADEDQRGKGDSRSASRSKAAARRR